MKRFLNSFLLLLFSSSALPFLVHAQANFQDLEIPFAQFIRSAIGLVALISIVMVVIGGIKYLTAGGDKEGAAGASHTITYGIVGLIVTISAWIILSLLGTFLGVSFTTFHTTL